MGDAMFGQVFQDIAAFMGIAATCFAIGQWNGRRASTKDRIERSKIEEELRKTRQRIDRALNGKIFSQSVSDENQIFRRRPPNQKVICFFNYKGGVGKTTLALNLGAYFADQSAAGVGQRKKVLFIDLDYQGSLSAPLIRSIGATENRNAVRSLYEPEWLPEKVLDASREINHDRLRGSRFLEASFALAVDEERLKFDWALQKKTEDIRFRIAKILASEQFKSFDVVIIDCPPRQTILTIAALCASTHLVVPMKLDRLSALAVPQLIASLREFRADLWPELQIAGVLGTFSQHETLSEAEKEHLHQAHIAASRIWGARVATFSSALPVRAPIAKAAGDSIAYFDSAATGAVTPPHALFNRIGTELAERIGYGA